MKPRSNLPVTIRSLRHTFTLTSRQAYSITVFFLLLLPLVFFWRETLGALTLGDQDALFWFLPNYKLVAEQLRAGELPLWNPYVYSGMPLFALLQAGVLDPINWIYLFGATSRTLTLAQQISFAIALWSAYSYARSLRWKRRAAITTAVIYAFSGFAVARTLYPGLLHIFALSPLPLLVIERLWQSSVIAGRMRWRAVVFGSFVVAWQIFAGHPQPFLYSALLAAAYALFCALLRKSVIEDIERVNQSAIDRSMQRRVIFLAQCALTYAAGAALAAVQLLPANEFVSQSVRREWNYEMFTAHSIHPVSLLTTLFPFFHGGGRALCQMPFWGEYWHHNEAQIYLGLAALSLAFTGAWCAWRARHRVMLFWSAVAVFGTLLALGKYVAPLAQLIYRLPMLSNFRSPNRHWMEVSLAVAVLAGFTVNSLLQNAETNCDEVAVRQDFSVAAKTLRIVATILAAFCVVTGFAFLWKPDFSENIIRLLTAHSLPAGSFRSAGVEFYLPVILAILAFILLVAFTRRAQILYPLLLLLLLADFQLYALLAPINSARKPEREFGVAIPEQIKPGVNEKWQWRTHVVLDGTTGDFSPDLYYGVEVMTGYDPLLSADYKTFSGVDESGHSYLTETLTSSDRTLDLLSVRYVIVPTQLLDEQRNPRAQTIKAALSDVTRWRKVTSNATSAIPPEHLIFENLRALPRAWLVSRVETMWEGDQLKTIRGQQPEVREIIFNPAVVAMISPDKAAPLEQAKLLQPAATIESPAARITRLVRTSSRSLSAEVETEKAGLLVISEVALPGWQARVNGIATDIHRVNYLLQGVIVPPGKHNIELIYAPASVRKGAMISAITLLMLLVTLFATWKKNSNSFH